MSIFGSRNYVYKPNLKRGGTFDTQAKQKALIGYFLGQDYRVLVSNRKRVIESKDVVVCGDPKQSEFQGENFVEFELDYAEIILNDEFPYKALHLKNDQVPSRESQPETSDIDQHLDLYYEVMPKTSKDSSGKIDLKQISYYTFVRHSERATAGTV